MFSPLIQIGLPLLGAALGNSVLDPSRALSLFAPLHVADSSIVTIKAIGPGGTSKHLTICSNFRAEALLKMAQKQFGIAHPCEM
jgi:hypothetical protein